MNEEVYTANVRIKDLPKLTDRIITTLAILRDVDKWEIVREALNEYAEKHKSEISVDVG